MKEKEKTADIYKEPLPATVPVMGVQDEDDDETDLFELASVLLHKWYYIVFFFLLGAVLFNAYAFFFKHPTYSSTASIYIVSASGGNVVDLTDLNIGSSLKNDYRELILSYPVLDRVSEKLDLPYGTSQMQSMITIDNPADTRILKLTCTAEDPQLAMDIANTLAEVAVQYLPDTMKTESPTIAQHARLSQCLSGSHYKKLTLIGGMLGALICCAVFIVLYLLDDTIHTAEDLEKAIGATPLAVIPYTKELDSKRNNSK